jgi:transcriptional regulator with XRE-family HTH domain
MFRIKSITSKEMKRYRLFLNLTQVEIAAQFGVTSNTYARWERNEVTPDSPELIALGFETLLNRKVIADADILRKELLDKTDVYIREVERMQNIGNKRIKH